MAVTPWGASAEFILAANFDAVKDETEAMVTKSPA
jgi:hypothetical protein